MEFWTAKRSADYLGVNLDTLYAYVSRKGIRSMPMSGSREHRYLRSDIERLRERPKRPKNDKDPPIESAITLLAEEGHYYRGRAASDLAETSSIESVAALLWDVDENVFNIPAPNVPDVVAGLSDCLADEPGVVRWMAMFPFIEGADPRAFDLSKAGMARTGVDIMRWLTAMTLRLPAPRTDPIAEQFTAALDLNAELRGLLQRILVLAADHGLEEATHAVRTVASTGVTPWRSIATGLAVVTGRSSKFGQNDAVRRLALEILGSAEPESPIVQRIRDQEDIPGFAHIAYPAGDPRAQSILAFCDAALADDADYRRLKRALQAAWEFKNLRPNFAITVIFADYKFGLRRARDAAWNLRHTESSFIVGRTAGWLAHAIEQYALGERGRLPVNYRGLFPRPSS
jgi:citrate synthase